MPNLAVLKYILQRRKAPLEQHVYIYPEESDTRAPELNNLILRRADLFPKLERLYIGKEDYTFYRAINSPTCLTLPPLIKKLKIQGFYFSRVVSQHIGAAKYIRWAIKHHPNLEHLETEFNFTY